MKSQVKHYMKKKSVGQCYQQNVKGQLQEIDKESFLKTVQLYSPSNLRKPWRNIVFLVNSKEITKNIFQYKNYYILIDKTKEDLETHLQKVATSILTKTNIVVDLKGFTKEDRDVLNYVILLEMNIANLIKNREIALVYDKNGFRNQDNQWLFNVEGKEGNLILDLTSNSDIFHMFQPYSSAVVVVSHNHPNNTTFSLVDIETFLSKDKLKTMIAVTNNKIYILNKYNFNYEKYNKISKILHTEMAGKYYEPYLTKLRNTWLNRMESLGIEMKEVNYVKK